jgi:hypothetical protein
MKVFAKNFQLQSSGAIRTFAGAVRWTAGSFIPD